MNIKLLLNSIILIPLLSGCGTFSSEAVIKSHNLKREALFDGSVETNFEYASLFLKSCYPEINQSGEVESLYGPVSTAPLTAKFIHEKGKKQILLGNSVSGALSYIEFIKNDQKTTLIAYNSANSEHMQRKFTKYINSIETRNRTECD